MVQKVGSPGHRSQHRRPSISVNFLGIEVDVDRMKILLLPVKLQQVKTEIHKRSRREFCAK